MTMTPAPDERAATGARQVAAYDRLEEKLRDIIGRPHWKVRNGKLLHDADGNPVPDPRPAREAQATLRRVQRDRKRLTGT